MSIELIHGDCMDYMRSLPDNAFELAIVDPPYGTTACKWDTVIDLPQMWEQLKRITKPNGAIVMTASQPFTSALVMSNPKMFKYCWVWDKKKGGNIMSLKWQPYKTHEDIVIFCKSAVNYHPIKTPQKLRTGKTYSSGEANGIKNYGDLRLYNDKHPKSILEISNANQKGKVHPTQKPVALMEYLIRTYTNEGETVLDFTMGSGTTGVACKNLGRDFIGIELDQGNFDIAQQRINPTTTTTNGDSHAITRRY